MNDFFYYEQLCILENIAGQYQEGIKMCPVIRRAAEDISTRRYSAAVIGEFRRGKSSLINALIGADILPTDILATTAAVTRVRYGIERKIYINFKDGHHEERSVEELVDFATKLDKQKETMALSINDITVYYPSVLCKNHIEILDTPGLNDNEAMSEATLGVIGDVDAAIVVVSARLPLSLTEQNLIIDLLKQQGIRHLIFVVTFIDDFRRESEKNKIIEFIENRIKTEVLEQALCAFEGDRTLEKKAASILKSPVIYGVSSRQAMDGFINDDMELLEKSRFPKFKEELLRILTAAQSEDIPSKTKMIVEQIAGLLPSWKAAEERALTLRKEELNRWKFYMFHSRKELDKILGEMDTHLKERGFSSENGIDIKDLEKMLLKKFIKGLSSLREENNTNDNIYRVIYNAAEEAKDVLASIEIQLQTYINAEMDEVLRVFSALRSSAGFDNEELLNNIGSYKELVPFPIFRWAPFPADKNDVLVGSDIMPSIRTALQESIRTYENEMNKYIGNWRAVFLQQNKKDRETCENFEYAEKEWNSIQMKLGALSVNYSQHLQKIESIGEKVTMYYEKEMEVH